LGFGIRVPGVRISTGGVRVGPRVANIGVSYKGRVTASVGPRIGRVSISGSGARVGTGVGPLGASVGRGGLRMNGHIGPAFGSIGRSGGRVGVGVGPLWVSAGGSRGPGRSRLRTPSDRSGKIRMSDSYAQYRQDLTSSGYTRRSRDELRMAGINAAFSSAIPVLAPLQKFTRLSLKTPSHPDLANWASNWAKQLLSSQGRYALSSVPVPSPPTEEELLLLATEQLARVGTVLSDHPVLRYGFASPGIPPREDVKHWASKRVKTQAGLGGRLLRRKQLKREIDSLITDSLATFEADHVTWLKQTREFEDLLKKAMDELRDSSRKQRDELQRTRDSEEAEVLKVAKFRREEQVVALDIIERTVKLYNQGDPVITTIVLQAAFSDNEGSAAPIGIDGKDLLVLMTAPPASDVIWPESLEVRQNITVRKKSKEDRETYYSIFLLCHTVATAKEAFAVAPNIQRVKILVLDEKEGDKNPLDRPLLAVLEVDRARVEKLPNGFELLPAISKGVEAMTSWDRVRQSGNPHAIVQWIEWFESVGCRPYLDLHRTGLELLEPFEDEGFKSWSRAPRSKRPKLINVTEPAVNTSDEVQFTENLSVEDLEIMDLSADEMNTYDFWMLCALLAEHWDADEVDLAKLKEQASTLVECLYPFEESDIDWSLRTTPSTSDS